jgi:hypothetical protein
MKQGEPFIRPVLVFVRAAKAHQDRVDAEPVLQERHSRDRTAITNQEHLAAEGLVQAIDGKLHGWQTMIDHSRRNDVDGHHLTGDVGRRQPPHMIGHAVLDQFRILVCDHAA